MSYDTKTWQIKVNIMLMVILLSKSCIAYQILAHINTLNLLYGILCCNH